MAQTIVTLCDECLAGGTEVPGQAYGVTIEVPNAKAAPYVIDACPMHAEPLLALVKALGEYGRRSDRKVPLPRSSNGPVRAPEATPAAPWACPDCPRTFPKSQGLSMHLRRAHGYPVEKARPLVAAASPDGHG